MPTFRVHFETGKPLDVEADTPDAARKQAKGVRPGGLVRKVKRVKQEKSHAA